MEDFVKSKLEISSNFLIISKNQYKFKVTRTDIFTHDQFPIKSVKLIFGDSIKQKIEKLFF